MNLYNIFENIKFTEEKEIEEIIFENKKIKITRILSLDQITEEMAENNLEIVLVASGSVEILINKKKIILKKGDVLPIPAKTPHKILKQDHVIWYCVFAK